MKAIDFGGRRIGPGEATFVIAEAGINHNGDPAIAERMIRAAAEAGADAIKFQTFTTGEFISRSNPYFGLFEKCELEADMFATLADCAKAAGIAFFSTPLDFASVDLLEDLGVPGFKIASCDLTNVPLIARIASAGKPIILSTGMGSVSEIFAAIDAINAAGNDSIVLLHCVSHYPAEAADVNLRAIPRMIELYDRPVGFSDHTLGVTIPIASVALGACVIEKHFTLDKKMDGPDHQISTDPAELRSMIAQVRLLEDALGEPRKIPVESADHIAVLRRSLVARRTIPAGQQLTAEDVAIKRPGDGIQPREFDRVVGRRARADIAEDSLIRWDDLE